MPPSVPVAPLCSSRLRIRVVNSTGLQDHKLPVILGWLEDGYELVIVLETWHLTDATLSNSPYFLCSSTRSRRLTSEPRSRWLDGC